VTGSDPEDPVTPTRRSTSLDRSPPGLDTATLKGKRIGAFRQRFVGFTGEREVAANMEKVIKELQAAGAIVVDVAIPDYDAKYAAGRGISARFVARRWTGIPGARIETRRQGADDPGSARLRQARAGQRAPSRRRARADADRRRTRRGDEAFIAGRETFRQLFVDLMDQHKLDAMLYPANHARPHTHEGGLERYGSEPGTCEESAATGLPQVTVPAGFIGGRYPAGSLSWADVG
jgi:Asp-tRNA(Asn)/Glu-tRNA(Gln) amidotransferase A subunit family amidase